MDSRMESMMVARLVGGLVNSERGAVNCGRHGSSSRTEAAAEAWRSWFTGNHACEELRRRLEELEPLITTISSIVRPLTPSLKPRSSHLEPGQPRKSHMIQNHIAPKRLQDRLKTNMVHILGIRRYHFYFNNYSYILLLRRFFLKEEKRQETSKNK
ncbi:FGGY family of carbohydrate kinase [Striga asiatica]|uniref:FGGY family of carbohydrate kinase n=1 Tax=Striga asiatica TaxID=4170 RepID=A0A5A7RLL2_STRAF|nr:FGGY family of carbohydrate kinase [Striga asiatica]